MNIHNRYFLRIIKIPIGIISICCNTFSQFLLDTSWRHITSAFINFISFTIYLILYGIPLSEFHILYVAIFKFKLSFLFHTLVLSASVSVYANSETKNQLSKSCHIKKDIININPPKNNQLLPFSIPLQNKISPTSTNNNFISYFPSFFKGHYNIYW